MSAVRFDTSQWFSGCIVFGQGGFGVLGSTIPSTGLDGPAYVYGDLSLPGDASSEICGHITAFPSAGTFTASEDTSFVFTAPDGSYTATKQDYVDGAAVGSPKTITLNIGAGGNNSAAPGVGTFAFTGFAPTVSQSSATQINPDVGLLTFTGFAPTVAATGLRLADPGVGLLRFTGYSPHVVNQSYDSDVGSIGNISMFATGPLWG